MLKPTRLPPPTPTTPTTNHLRADSPSAQPPAPATARRASARRCSTIKAVWTTSLKPVIDRDLLHAAKGAVMEAAGTVLGNEDLADRGRLTQFHHIRRRQVRLAKNQLSDSRLGRVRDLLPGVGRGDDAPPQRSPRSIR